MPETRFSLQTWSAAAIVFLWGNYTGPHWLGQLVVSHSTDEYQISSFFSFEFFSYRGLNNIEMYETPTKKYTPYIPKKLDLKTLISSQLSKIVNLLYLNKSLGFTLQLFKMMAFRSLFNCSLNTEKLSLEHSEHTYHEHCLAKVGFLKK